MNAVLRRAGSAIRIPQASTSRLIPLRLSSSAAPPSLPPTALPRPSLTKAKKKPKLPPPPSTAPIPTLPSLAKHKIQSTSTPSDSGKVVALSSCDSFDLPVLLRGLQALNLLGGKNPAINLLGECVHLPAYEASFTLENGDIIKETGEVYIFESGSVVTWGISVEGAESFLRRVIRGGPEGGESGWGWVEKGRALEPEMEVLHYRVEADTPTRMVGDQIILSSPPLPPTPSPLVAGVEPSSPNVINDDLLARLAYSSGMARVTKLGLYEEKFELYADGVAGIPAALESGSESPVRKRDIIIRMGILHGYRQALNLDDTNLLDEPEFLWDSPQLHQHFEGICSALEFDARLRVLNQRVDYAFQLQQSLMEILNTKTSHRLEWIIIVLIAMEISLVLWRELPAAKRHRARMEAEEVQGLIDPLSNNGD